MFEDRIAELNGVSKTAPNKKSYTVSECSIESWHQNRKKQF